MGHVNRSEWLALEVLACFEFKGEQREDVCLFVKYSSRADKSITLGRSKEYNLGKNVTHLGMTYARGYCS